MQCQRLHVLYTASITVTFNSTYGELPTVTRTGYTFAGWYTTASGGTKVESTTTVTTASNHTLYAHWTANIITVTITYDAMGGTGEPTAETIEKGTSYTISTTVPAKTGYAFKGWSIYKYATIASYTAGGTIPAENIVSDMTLYAVWVERKMGSLKVGDYVSYTPDGTYDGKVANTSMQWRVWSIKGSEVLITPTLTSSGADLFTLSGEADYIDMVNNSSSQTDKLNKACKALYTNNTLGITGADIRSMTLEDIKEACGYTISYRPFRYAFYPEGSSVSGTITYNGNTYEKKEHLLSTAKFYTYDGGGVEAKDSNGYTYRTPEADNPVYITSTSDGLDPSFYNHVENSSITVGSLLGPTLGSLSTSDVCLYGSYAEFRVCYAGSSNAGSSYGVYLFRSYGVSGKDVRSLRPIVSLSSTLQVTGGDGTSSAPWQLSK